MCSVKHMFKLLQTILLLFVVHERLLLVALSQDQSGFISIDCGLSEDLTYTEEETKLSYVSDEDFVSGGESKVVLPEYRVNKQRHVQTLRSFPEGTRNCYTANTRKGTLYLIRATFLYGNYDAKKSPPKFDLHIGTNHWDTVELVDAATLEVREAIHLQDRDYVHVCLANTGFGTPFISALELRPLKNRTYLYNPNELLRLFVRYDVGSLTNESYRYPYDISDRLWSSNWESQWKGLSTSEAVRSNSDKYKFLPPSIVMKTAVTPANTSAPLVFNFESGDANKQFYVFLHCAEIQRIKPNESRAFTVSVNGEVLHSPHSPEYLASKTLWFNEPITGELSYALTLDKLEFSTLPPILNAFEIYDLAYKSLQETDENDVEAIGNLKSVYGVKRNWDGDPCLPMSYLWAGLKCSVNDSAPSRITSLDLSSSALTGEISLSIGDLDLLEFLDLSDNDLTGPVPPFLTQLPNLKVLNLRKNNFSGILPEALFQRWREGSLSLSIEENQYLCTESPCEQKKNKNNDVLPIALSVCGSILLLALTAAIFILIRKNKKQALRTTKTNMESESLDTKKRQFTYDEIVNMTNNFEKVLGRGGFGTVYYGILVDGTEVAVKLSHPGAEQHSKGHDKSEALEAQHQFQLFQAEVKLLLTVYHGNLTSLVGYCNQGINRALIYEYMANGDLESYLSGLEYLHSGCKPPIIHRDIKAANILISDNYGAKLADFGLSKFFLTEDGTHLSTMHIAGTRGYLDPDLTSGQLNQKNDVYSFGVVMLRIITGRPVIKTVKDDTILLGKWVSSSMEKNGNITDIADPVLRGDFDINSASKFIEIAMSCLPLSESGIERPNMSRVVTGLRECLVLELARNQVSFLTDSSISKSDFMCSTTVSECKPLGR